MTTYSMDTSALVDGINRYYRPSVHRSLWDKIDGLIDAGRVIATEEVRIEVCRKEDRLTDWCKQRSKMFLEVDEAIQPAVSQILAAHPKLIKAMSNKSSADPFVIALAFVKGGTVVSAERASGSSERPRIPDVCDAFGIKCFTLMDVMEAEGWVF